MKTYEKENGSVLTLEDMATMIRQEGKLCRGRLHNRQRNRCFMGVITDYTREGAPVSSFTEESRYELYRDFDSYFGNYPEELNDIFRGTNKARAEYMALCCEELAAAIEYYNRDRRERSDEHELGVAEIPNHRFHE